MVKDPQDRMGANDCVNSLIKGMIVIFHIKGQNIAEGKKVHVGASMENQNQRQKGEGWTPAPGYTGLQSPF